MQTWARLRGRARARSRARARISARARARTRRFKTCSHTRSGAPKSGPRTPQTNPRAHKGRPRACKTRLRPPQDGPGAAQTNLLKKSIELELINLDQMQTRTRLRAEPGPQTQGKGLARIERKHDSARSKSGLRAVNMTQQWFRDRPVEP